MYLKFIFTVPATCSTACKGHCTDNDITPAVLTIKTNGNAVDFVTLRPAHLHIIGVVAFLVGHIFYIVALQNAILSIGYSAGAFVWYEIAIVATILVLALVYGLKTNVFKRKGAMAYGLVVYGLVLATMLAKAVRCVADTYASGSENALMVLLTVGVGALLFVMSDLSLGVILSVDKPLKKGMRIFNIETYYIAQILLAGSMFYVFS